MKITCSKSNLVKGVSIVSKAVPSKTTMPILECILIDATTDIIKLTANDMELALVAAVVYQGWMTGGLQCPVGAGRPCRPPNLHIPFVVPVGGPDKSGGKRLPVFQPPLRT